MKKPLRIANMGAEGEIVGRPPSPVSSSPGEDLRLNDLHHLGGSVVNPTKSTAGPGFEKMAESHGASCLLKVTSGTLST